jgi:hypothetical protein
MDFPPAIAAEGAIETGAAAPKSLLRLLLERVR